MNTLNTIRPLKAVIKYRFDNIQKCIDGTPRVLAWASGIGIDSKECWIEKGDDGSYTLWSKKPDANSPPASPACAVV